MLTTIMRGMNREKDEQDAELRSALAWMDSTGRGVKKALKQFPSAENLAQGKLQAAWNRREKDEGTSHKIHKGTGIKYFTADMTRQPVPDCPSEKQWMREVEQCEKMMSLRKARQARKVRKDKEVSSLTHGCTIKKGSNKPTGRLTPMFGSRQKTSVLSDARAASSKAAPLNVEDEVMDVLNTIITNVEETEAAKVSTKDAMSRAAEDAVAMDKKKSHPGPDVYKYDNTYVPYFREGLW